MSNRPPLPQRKSLRYKGYDYASVGAYFVTVCVRYGRCLLGEVCDGEMIPNEAGRMVETCWHELANRFPTLALDEFQVMPNHVHGIVWLRPPVGAQQSAPVVDPAGAASGAPTDVHDPTGNGLINSPTLGQVMRSFKSKSALAANQTLQRSGHFWLRNYWDRIIRDDRELDDIRAYIRTNPQRWQDDQLHPDAPPNQWKQQWTEGQSPL